MAEIELLKALPKGKRNVKVSGDRVLEVGYAKGFPVRVLPILPTTSLGAVARWRSGKFSGLHRTKGLPGSTRIGPLNRRKCLSPRVLTAKFHDYPAGWIDLFREAGYTGITSGQSTNNSRPASRRKGPIAPGAG